MNLPNAETARIDREKITEYLLSSVHPDGRSKAAFFCTFGFQLERWEVLQDALTRHAANNPVTDVVESRYGTRYVVEGPLDTPDGRSPVVRSVWIMEHGTDAPRLVTAYPGR
jgi:hypothetical protein